MISEVKTWVYAAAKQVGLDAKALPDDLAREIVQQAMQALVVGNPRAWWMSPKGKALVYDSKTHRLSAVAPKSDDGLWFIPETENHELPVFDLAVSEIEVLLDECPLIEYYVVEKRFRWFVAESDHHGAFHLCFAPETSV